MKLRIATKLLIQNIINIEKGINDIEKQLTGLLNTDEEKILLRLFIKEQNKLNNMMKLLL